MEEINNILETLKTSLQNVDSARLQTEKTVNAYNELQETVRGYILSIEQSVEALNNMLEIYKRSKTMLENDVNDAIKTVVEKSDHMIFNLEKSVEYSINTFNVNMENHMKTLESSIYLLSHENNKLINLKNNIDILSEELTKFKSDINDAGTNIEKRIIDNHGFLVGLTYETHKVENTVNKGFDELKTSYWEGTKNLKKILILNAVLLIIIIVFIFIK